MVSKIRKNFYDLLWMDYQQILTELVQNQNIKNWPLQKEHRQQSKVKHGGITFWNEKIRSSLIFLWDNTCPQ